MASTVAGVPSLADLRSQYAAAVEAMKTMSPDNVDEVTLIRVALSCKGDVQKCIAKWGSTLTWRETNGLVESAQASEEKENDRDNALLRWCPASYNFCEVLTATDDQKTNVALPVTFVHWGNMNPLQLMGNADPTALLEQQGRVLMKALREMNVKSKESGYLVRGVYVVDLEGVGLDHIGGDFIKFLTPLFDLAEKNFSEVIGRVVFVKAPLSYAIGWKTMQPLLAEGTQDKCLKLGFEFKEDLFQLIPESVLPEYLGGSNMKTCFTNFEEDFQVEFVDPRRSFVVEVEFNPAVHDFVDWEFRTEKNDISFSAVFVPSSDAKDDQVEIVKSKRVDTSKVLVSGKFEPKSKGTLRCTFDNSFSFLTQKALIYRVRVIPKKK